MKKLTIAFLAIATISFFVFTPCRGAVEKGKKWIDITKEVLVNPANKAGWTHDDKGKIFKDASESNLKVVTSMFGTFIVDLDKLSVVKVDSDGKQTTLEKVKLIQRDFGLSIVIRNADMKIRCKLKEKVKGMKNVPAIKAL